MGMPLPLSRFVRAALLAVVVGAGVLTAAAPAQAFPYSPGLGPYFPHPHHRVFPGYPFFPGYPIYPPYPVYPIYPRPVCMSDWQVRNALGASGYYNVRIYRSGSVIVQASANRGPWRYFISFNRCTGNIVGVSR